MLAKLGKGDEVITRGGVIGKITGVSDDGVLVLELQEKVRVRMPRAYIEGKWEGKVPSDREARVRELGSFCVSLGVLHGSESLKWRTIIARRDRHLFAPARSRRRSRLTARYRLGAVRSSRRRSTSVSISRAGCISTTASTSTPRSTTTRPRSSATSRRSPRRAEAHAGVVVKTPFGRRRCDWRGHRAPPEVTQRRSTRSPPMYDDVGKGIIRSARLHRPRTATSERPPGSASGCRRTYADGIKKAALDNAVATIRERINEKGVAEPSVVKKGDDIIVELPGLRRQASPRPKRSSRAPRSSR